MALPAYHAFTGSDYTAFFSLKGKVRPLKLLEKMESAIETFVALGTNAEITKEIIECIEAFVCCIYGKKNHQSMKRLEILLQKFKPKGANDAVTRVKKFDGNSFLPCDRVLYEKICRTKYIAQLWLLLASRNPPDQSPEVLGWKIEDGKYTVKWFKGEVSPKPIDLEMTSTDDKLEEHVEEEG